MLTSEEIYLRLKAEFGTGVALAIMEVLYPDIYGTGRGKLLKIKRVK